MADLQGIKRNITEVALVCTEKQFADLYASDVSVQDKEYLRLDINQIRGELSGGVTKGTLKPGSVAVVPKSCSAYYLAFLLCSLPGQLFLYGQKFNVKAKAVINRKMVSTITVFEVEKDSENAYATAEVLKESAYTEFLEHKDDLNYERLYRLVADLCDMLALELYAHPLFEQKDIFILDNWKKVLPVTNDKNDILKALMALSDSNSPLRNEIMKAHILVHDFKDYIK